jgi:phosphate acetyltransferase
LALLDSIRQKAKSDKKRIVLPEGNEERILKAAEVILKEGIAELVILTDDENIREKYALEGVEIINPGTSPKLKEYADTLYELRKSKGITQQQAEDMIKNPLYYGAMMVKKGDADGMVAGSVYTTGDVLRPALQIVKTAPGISVVSSCFIMEVPNCTLGAEGVFVFADCAINIQPTAEQLAAIAISSAQTARSLVGIEPKVAMLSFSTKGSGKHELVDKVVEAVKLAKEMAPDLKLDGELQADAALIESVGRLKSPDSTVAGQANVLIFPDLQAGNIGYKLVQRLAKAEAIGPISQGLAKPINDLSRGCSVEDVVNVVAITAVQAQGMK